jgi:hypothetical protein
MPQFQVIGVDVMGDEDDDGYVSGPSLRRGAPRKTLVVANRAKWRDGQLAPGVQMPQEGMVSLPLSGPVTNTFSLNVQSITFQGVLQKPFRGERLLVNVVRTGTTAVGRLLGLIFVGTDLQQADITGLDLEQIGASNAFGVRLAMTAAQPGVWIRIPTNLSTPIATTDTIFCSIQLLGRVEH